ncbi:MULTISPECIES: hypothetical protein [unclassified Bifidobacterium]|uniref:variant leucine-rich repeat-containing protein n=1 Tax=unclassified Bifidobacterium TaxID=2608897 RepID=UPI00226A46DB|nr:MULTISPECIES: hypothetical protein [unclassified Bifidobacterium]
MSLPMMGGRGAHGHRGSSATERMSRLMTAISSRSRSLAEDGWGQDDPHGIQPTAEMRAPPPEPPLVPTALMAADPATDPSILWAIAREEPQLRRWLVANPAASPALLETISQLGGPGVRRALEVLLDEGNGHQSPLSS